MENDVGLLNNGIFISNHNLKPPPTQSPHFQLSGNVNDVRARKKGL